MEDTHVRKIKIHTKYDGKQNIPLPKSALIMSGLWLEDCGFMPGKMVNVEATKGQLIITLNNPSD